MATTIPAQDLVGVKSTPEAEETLGNRRDVDERRDLAHDVDARPVHPANSSAPSLDRQSESLEVGRENDGPNRSTLVVNEEADVDLEGGEEKPIVLDIEHVPVDDDPREWSERKKVRSVILLYRRYRPC